MERIFCDYKLSLKNVVRVLNTNNYLKKQIFCFTTTINNFRNRCVDERDDNKFINVSEGRNIGKHYQQCYKASRDWLVCQHFNTYSCLAKQIVNQNLFARHNRFYSTVKMVSFFHSQFYLKETKFSF